MTRDTRPLANLLFTGGQDLVGVKTEQQVIEREPRAYEEFMAQAEKKDPERVALIKHLYPVLSDSELERREAIDHEGDLSEAVY